MAEEADVRDVVLAFPSLLSRKFTVTGENASVAVVVVADVVFLNDCVFLFTIPTKSWQADRRTDRPSRRFSFFKMRDGPRST